MSTNLDYQVNEAIKDNNIKVGIAINPNTWLFKIKKYLKYKKMLKKNGYFFVLNLFTFGKNSIILLSIIWNYRGYIYG